MENEFNVFLDKYGIDLSEGQLRQIDVFEQALIAKNAVMNLVSPKDEPLIRTRHILDSLAAVPVISRMLGGNHAGAGLAKIADCGSGAGFPGIPLAIALPEMSFSLFDSQNKRCVFLNEAAALAGIKNVQAFHERLGEGKPQPVYDIMTERAMGHLEDIMPLCARSLKKGGFFLAWQSSAQVNSDRPEVEKAAKKAKLRLFGSWSYRLPAEENDRFILIYVKI